MYKSRHYLFKNHNLSIYHDFNMKINIILKINYKISFFFTCINSLINQTYKNINIICLYHDNRCLEYLRFVDDYRFKYFKYNSNNISHSFLINKIESGWVMFLNENDLLIDVDILQKIVDNIKSYNDFIHWNIQLNENKVCSINHVDLKIGDIKYNSFCLNIKYLHLLEYQDDINNSFRLKKESLDFKKINNKFIEEVLSKKQDKETGLKIKLKTGKTYHLVVSSTQYPGYGGAATNAYEIIKFLRKNDINTVGVFFHNVLNVNYDPDNIGGVFLYLDGKYDSQEVRNDVKSYLKTEPNYCLCKNYRAPYVCKEIFQCYTVYLVSGINHFNLFYPRTSAVDFLENSFVLDKNKINIEEVKTNKLCDSIITNSHLAHKLFQKIYPNYLDKLKPFVDTTFCVRTLNQKVFIKEYDIILICSNFKRESKNQLFLLDVLNNKCFDKYKKIMIGQESEIFKNIKNSLCLPLQLHHKCIEYMSKSKFLLHTAVCESNSNTMREAYYHKCLPLITRNVGYYELYPEYLICNNFTINEWVNKLNNVLEKYEEIKDIKINYNKSLDINKLFY